MGLIDMKKALSFALVLVMLLCLCACSSKYVCAECGDNYENEQSKYSTNDLCRDCYNQKPYGDKYCVCGNPSSRSTKSGTYLCTKCWDNVENAIQNALGGK